MASAVDMVTASAGPLRLLADGTTWNSAGAAGPRFALATPVRLLGASDGTVMAVNAAGAIAASSSGSGAGHDAGHVSMPADATVVDAALFAGTHSGFALDSTGTVRAFGGVDAALAALPSMWTLPGQPAAMILAGTPQAPAGLFIDASGDWQPFGSLLLLSDETFGGPVFDPTTGLPVR
jgi:hypothetical protein